MNRLLYDTLSKLLFTFVRKLIAITRSTSMSLDNLHSPSIKYSRIMFHLTMNLFRTIFIALIWYLNRETFSARISNISSDQTSSWNLSQFWHGSADFLPPFAFDVVPRSIYSNRLATAGRKGKNICYIIATIWLSLRSNPHYSTRFRISNVDWRTVRIHKNNWILSEVRCPMNFRYRGSSRRYRTNLVSTECDSQQIVYFEHFPDR